MTIFYNETAGIVQTLKSVINQRCDEYQSIVIDGQSTDSSKEIMGVIITSATLYQHFNDGEIILILQMVDRTLYIVATWVSHFMIKLPLWIPAAAPLS